MSAPRRPSVPRSASTGAQQKMRAPERTARRSTPPPVPEPGETSPPSARDRASGSANRPTRSGVRQAPVRRRDAALDRSPTRSRGEAAADGPTPEAQPTGSGPVRQERRTRAPVRPRPKGAPHVLTPEHVAFLEAAAIPADWAAARGIRSVCSVEELPPAAVTWGEAAVPGLVFPWTSSSGERVDQHRPDRPLRRSEGERHKYLWPAGQPLLINVIEPNPEADTIFLVEGTKQAYAAAHCAPDGSRSSASRAVGAGHENIRSTRT
jgi:hypothetical protein